MTQWWVEWCQIIEDLTGPAKYEVDWYGGVCSEQRGCRTVFFCMHIKSIQNKVSFFESFGGNLKRVQKHIRYVCICLLTVLHSYREGIWIVVYETSNLYARDSHMNETMTEKSATCSIHWNSKKLQSIIHTIASRCIHKDDCMALSIWTLCLDEVVRCVVHGETEDKSNENVNSLLNTIWEHIFRTLASLMDRKLQA